MRTNKPIVALTAALVLVAAFAGCTKKTETTPGASGSTNGADQITVAFVSIYEQERAFPTSRR